MHKDESEIGESVNCSEGWMSDSRTRVCDSSAGVVTTDIGGDRRGAAAIGVRFGRSGTDNWFLLSGVELVEGGLGGWTLLEFQSKPRPMQVTPQLLPTLAAL